MDKLSQYLFIRTCQECGHLQQDNEPTFGKELPKGYDERICAKCKSQAFDYGSTMLVIVHAKGKIERVEENDEEE